MAADICWLIVIFMLGVAWLAGTWHRRQPQGGQAAVHATVQRCLRPRTPDDCPACRQASTLSTVVTPARLPPPPWREVKSQRGAPKRIATHGFACPAPSCTYYRITDAQIHALVGDGTHGQHERIQTFRCQACRTTFSARRDTPLYRLKTSSYRVGEVLTALVEGLDVAAAVRVFGHSEGTISRWLTRAGVHSQALHARWFHNLHLLHVQLDELRTLSWLLTPFAAV